jgi:hypothetical protein
MKDGRMEKLPSFDFQWGCMQFTAWLAALSYINSAVHSNPQRSICYIAKQAMYYQGRVRH